MDTNLVNDLLLCTLEGDDLKVFMRCVGKQIKSIEFDGDKLMLMLDDNNTLDIWDNGQNCCERRYMTTDDNLAEYVGARLLNIAVKPCIIPPAEWMEDDSGDCHDIEFLEVMTTKGAFTMTNHNEHNGYYAGFDVRLEDDTTRRDDGI